MYGKVCIVAAIKSHTTATRTMEQEESLFVMSGYMTLVHSESGLLQMVTTKTLQKDNALLIESTMTEGTAPITVDGWI